MSCKKKRTLGSGYGIHLQYLEVHTKTMSTGNAKVDRRRSCTTFLQGLINVVRNSIDTGNESPIVLEPTSSKADNNKNQVIEVESCQNSDDSKVIIQQKIKMLQASDRSKSVIVPEEDSKLNVKNEFAKREYPVKEEFSKRARYPRRQFVYARPADEHWWYKCSINNVTKDQNGHPITYELKSLKKRKIVITEQHHIAHDTIPLRSELRIGLRIIGLLSYISRVSLLFFIPAFYGIIKKYKGGLIAEVPSESNNDRYLIFFDDGFVSYLHEDKIRIVWDQSNKFWSDLDSVTRSFFQEYLTKYPDFPLKEFRLKQSVIVEWKGYWWDAIIHSLDCSLVEVMFLTDKKTEVLYRGTPRIDFADEESSSPISINDSEECMEEALTDHNYHDLDFGSMNSGYLKKKKINTRQHQCTIACGRIEVPDLPTQVCNPLLIPEKLGWTRKPIKGRRFEDQSYYYIAPCSRKLTDLTEINNYLILTKTKNVSIDHFAVESITISNNSFVPGKCMNESDITQVSESFTYIADSICIDGLEIPSDPDFMVCCNCKDNCLDKTKCECQRLTYTSNAAVFGRSTHSVGYELKRLAARVLTGIYECNPRCTCKRNKAGQCYNSVVQNGIQHRLQVFMTTKKGWGVRTLDDIPKGAFVSMYAGVVITEQEAQRRGVKHDDQYYAELDLIEMIIGSQEAKKSKDCRSSKEENNKKSNKNKTSSKEDLENCSDNLSDQYNRSYSEKDATSNCFEDVVSTSEENRQNSIEYYHDSLSEKLFDVEVSDDEDRTTIGKTVEIEGEEFRQLHGGSSEPFIVDSKRIGNIGRFYNHSCDPNMFVQNVFWKTQDLRFPTLSFFTLRSIPAGSELTWDYGYEMGSVEGKVKYCFCGASNCRKRLY
ncbi:uncharacterized protein TRIADDRAFT_64362 [Trichoplax adhaerens]|uniref:Histone-lysine N-methyltransferase eggless n=1 Tax=Trichoplax adhaerens TaxID=10228 RepID=B3SBL5_TRIAD|nr:hypothetical protein TRIADDRAFT_64362 [Trichoplax adhaerens]EDV19880.1 hypothetical protein TRIADDRAFT_64362 [Trichoplax adhaerens]|eukprot:XP_002117622.1 hypothetical protein TRIADDRAFT_64362 [Trichoplax adhaerens]